MPFGCSRRRNANKSMHFGETLKRKYIFGVGAETLENIYIFEAPKRPKIHAFRRRKRRNARKYIHFRRRRRRNAREYITSAPERPKIYTFSAPEAPTRSGHCDVLVDFLIFLRKWGYPRPDRFFRKFAQNKKMSVPSSEFRIFLINAPGVIDFAYKIICSHRII